MRKFIFSVFWCVMFTLTFQITFGQVNNKFKYLHPSPQGSYLRWVKMWDANNWYAIGYDATFMKTSDGGSTWSVYNSFFYDASGYDFHYCGFFINMNTGWMGGNSGRIFKTTNAGVDWDTSLVAVSTGATWYGLYFLDANTGFASGTSSGRVAMTTDGGANWSMLGTPPSATYYNVWASDANNVIATSTSGNIRKTTDGGANWTTVSTGTSSTLYGLAFMNPDTGYVCGSSTGIRYTTDFGDTWTSTNTGVASSTFYDVDISNGNVYVTGNSFNVYGSPILQDNFDTLQILNNSQPWTSTFYAADVLGDTITCVGAYGMINTRYSPSNRVAHTTWIKAGNFYDIWAESTTGNVIAVGSPGSAGAVFDQVMYSTNGGQDWAIGDFSATADEDLNSICMLNADTGFVAGDEGGVHKTINGGANWTPLNSFPGSTELNKVIFFDDNTGYVFGTTGQGHKTTNGGDNWTTLTTGMGTSTIYGASFVDENTGWVVGASGKVFMTTDGGANFSAQTSNYSSTLYEAFMLNGTTGWISGSSGRIRRTNDGGVNWDTADVPFTSTNYSVCFVDSLNGMVSGSSGRVYITTDGGTSWETHISGYSTNYNLHMISKDEAYICGSLAAVFVYNEIISGGIEITFTNNVPERYFLEQNYPNPFNPSTTIKFGLPREGTVSLRVYDMAGREVSNLINNEKMNRGIVSYNFNGSSLASGVYFYTLVVDNNLIATKKMVLLK